MVPERGLEPPHLAAPAPKAGVSTNFTTPAGVVNESKIAFISIMVNMLIGRLV